MKPFPLLLTTLALATRLLGLDAAELAAVTGKFANSTPDEQYQARVELNRLLDTSTAPGKGDPAAVTKLVAAALAADTTPVEAKKYLLRALARIGTAEAVEAAAQVLAGTDAMLREEARQVLEAIPAPQAAAVLEKALAAAKAQPAQLALIQSLAAAKATGAIPALAELAGGSDPETGRAAVAALGRIGGPETVAALKRAWAKPQLAAAVKAEVERGLLAAAAGDIEVVRQLYLKSSAAPVRVAAFLILTQSAPPAEAAAAVEAALKKESGGLLQAALRRGLELNLPVLQHGLADKLARLGKGERLVVLANISLVKPASEAGKIALASAAAEDPDERVAALHALGKLATQPAFEAVLQALGAREPAVNRAAGQVLAEMNYPAAEATLLAAITRTAPGPDKLLGLKAAAYRHLPGINPLLLKVIGGTDEEAAKEAMKTLYFTATLDDLRTLAGTAKSATDPKAAASLASLCRRIATRLEAPEALQVIESLK
jgi:HEAT repeat protein